MLRVKNNSQQRSKGALLSYVYSFAQIVVGLLYVPILIGGMGQNEYGLYQLVGSVIAYLGTMNSVLSGGITRFYCKYFIEGDQTRMENVLAIGRSINRIIAILLIPITIVIIILINQIYSASLTNFQLIESSIMMIVLASNIVVSLNNIINVAVINAHEQFVFLKITQILSVILQPLIIIIVIANVPYALAVCLVQFAMNIVCATFQRVFARNILKARVVMHSRDKKLYKELIVFSSGMLLVLVADQVFWKTNQLILGYSHGMDVVAVYAIAMQICTSFQPLGTSISSVFMPKLSELYFNKNDIKAMYKLFCSIGRIAGYPLFLVLFGFMIFGKSFIELWAGNGFEEAYFIALIAMIPLTLELLQHLGLYILQVMNKYSFRGILFGIMALVQIILVLILAPTFGPLSAACVTAVVYFIGNSIVMNLYYRSILKCSILSFWKGIIKELIPMIIYSALFLCCSNMLSIEFNTWSSLIIGLILFAVFFAVVAYSFSMNEEEKRLLKTFSNRIIHSKK